MPATVTPYNEFAIEECSNDFLDKEGIAFCFFEYQAAYLDGQIVDFEKIGNQFSGVFGIERL